MPDTNALTPTHLLSLLARGTDDERLGDSHGLGEVLVEDMLPDMHAPWRMGMIEALLPGCTQSGGTTHLLARTPAELVALRESWYEITSMLDPEAKRISHDVDSWAISCPYTDERIAQIAQDPGFPVIVTLQLNSYDDMKANPDLPRAHISTDPLLSPVDGTGRTDGTGGAASTDSIRRQLRQAVGDQRIDLLEVAERARVGDLAQQLLTALSTSELPDGTELAELTAAMTNGTSVAGLVSITADRDEDGTARLWLEMACTQDHPAATELILLVARQWPALVEQMPETTAWIICQDPVTGKRARWRAQPDSLVFARDVPGRPTLNANPSIVVEPGAW